MSAPHVAPWWRDPSDPVSLEYEYGPVIDGADGTEAFIVELDREPIGFIQHYEIVQHRDWERALRTTGLEEPSVGIDYLIGPENRVGGGLGPAMIEQFVRATWSRYPTVSVIAVVIDQDNRRSWRALEKIGFQRAWTGHLVTDDPNENGPSFLYLMRRRPHVGAP